MSFLGDYTLRLGYILGVTPKHIIVRPKNWSRDKKIPPLGLEIYDAKAMSVGRITDIIGPVFKPYFKIKPSRPNLSASFSSLVGEPLYTMPEPRGKGMVKQSMYKGKNVKDKRQPSNKTHYRKSSKTRNYSKTSKPRNKTPK